MVCKNLMYVSHAKSINDTTSILSEVEKFRGFNEGAYISGVLLHIAGEKKSYFTQFLEGPSKEVLALYENIVQDKRHENVQIVYENVNGNRFFENWSMGLISSNPRSNANVLVTEAEINELFEKLERSSPTDIIEIMQEMYLHMG